MTAQKPPDKTLVGMPADLKAVLEKLDQATADKSVFSDPPRGSAFDPHQARQANRPRTVPPPLPATQGAVPPQQTAALGPTEPVPMDRTLIGMPSDMQAALARAIAEHANAAAPPPVAPPPRPAPTPAPRPAAPRTPPTAAGPALRAQPVRAIGGPSTPASEAQVPVLGGRGPAPVPKPTAAASYQPVPPRAAPTYASGLGYQGGPSYQDPSRPVLAPQAPLDWPPAMRRSDPGLAPVTLQEAHVEVSGTEATQLAVGSQIPLDGNTIDADASQPMYSQRLALPVPTDELFKKTQRTRKLSKRGIAIAAAGLGVAALVGLGVWLGPRLLAGRTAESADAAAPAASGAPTLPAAPAGVVTDTAAATNPGRFTPTPTPTRPPATPAMTSGPSAQLEKKAIERLVASDYAGAKQLYEKLRSAEPTRPEFALMVELLERAGSRTTGAAP